MIFSRLTILMMMMIMVMMNGAIKAQTIDMFDQHLLFQNYKCMDVSTDSKGDFWFACQGSNPAALALFRMMGDDVKNVTLISEVIITQTNDGHEISKLLIDQNANDTIYVCGSGTGYISINPFVMKISSDGKRKEWTRQIGGTSRVGKCTGLAVSPSADIVVVAGQYRSRIIRFQYSDTGADDRGLLAGLKADTGIIVWGQLYGESASGDAFTSITYLGDSGYFVATFVRGITWLGDILENSSSMIVRLSASGEWLNTRSIAATLYTTHHSPNDTFISAGYAPRNNGTAGHDLHLSVQNGNVSNLWVYQPSLLDDTAVTGLVGYDESRVFAIGVSKMTRPPLFWIGRSTGKAFLIEINPKRGSAEPVKRLDLPSQSYLDSGRSNGRVVIFLSRRDDNINTRSLVRLDPNGKVKNVEPESNPTIPPNQGNTWIWVFSGIAGALAVGWFVRHRRRRAPAESLPIQSSSADLLKS
jgi:hypothetical protein